MKNKNLILGLFVMLGATAVSAQEMQVTDVPAELKKSFEQSYPDASEVEWEMKGDTLIVEFEINNEEQEVWYTPDGQTAKTVKEITETDLPEPVKSTINEKYSDYTIDSIDLIEEAGSTVYEVELQKGWTTEKDVIFDASGKVLSENED
jgi:uncharacterized membrane protein YkoI